MSQFHRIERNDTAMKRSVIGAVLACALVAGSVEMNPAGAVEIGADVYSVPIDKSNIVAVDAGTEVVSIEELPVETVDPVTISENKVGSMTRATKRIEWNIPAGKVMKANTAYFLETDEIVTINCTYSPRTADLDSDSLPRMIRSILPAGAMEVSKSISKLRILESITLRYETTQVRRLKF